MSRTSGFRVDESGFLRLLRKDIYPRKDVYLRELIQNAMDSQSSHVRLTLLTQRADNDVVIVAILCHDDGKGMTKAYIENYFLTLCRPMDKTSSPRYGRFGIGLFTYLAFASHVHVLTKSRRGTAWYFFIESPSEIASLRDVTVSTIAKVQSRRVGTTILLTPRHPLRVPDVLESLQHWIRGTLAAELVLDMISMDFPNEQGEALLGRLHEDSEGDVSRETIAFDIPSRPTFHLNSPLDNSDVRLTIGGDDEVALCESGVVVDSNCSDLIPRELHGIGFEGMISVKRGVLDLDAARSHARKDSNFQRVVKASRPYFEAALEASFNNRNVNASGSWGSWHRILLQLLAALPADAGAKWLRRLDRSIFFEILGSSQRLCLSELAAKASSIGRLHYLDVQRYGSDWGFRKIIGSIDSYQVEMFIGKLAMGESLSRRGEVVFRVVRNGEGKQVIPGNTLKEYFSQAFGLTLADVSTTTNPGIIASRFPAFWRKLTLPANAKVVSLPGHRCVYFDADKAALLDTSKDAFAYIDQALSDPPLPPVERSVIESYLALMAANLDDGLDSLRSGIRSIALTSTSSLMAAVRRIDAEISGIIEEHRESNWDEDFLTRTILHFLRKATAFITKAKDYPMQVRIEPLKLSGKKEQEFGDIGLLVHLRYRDGLTLEGAAFLEAKKMYPKERKYRKLNMPQLRAVLTHAPRAKVLLFDYEPIDLAGRESLGLERDARTYATTIPMNVCLHLNKVALAHIDDSLYRFGVPLAHQLFLRYFRGQDLEFHHDAIAAVRGDVPQLLVPRYVLCVAVALDGAEMPAMPTVNREIFQHFDGGHL